MRKNSFEHFAEGKPREASIGSPKFPEPHKDDLERTLRIVKMNCFGGEEELEKYEEAREKGDNTKAYGALYHCFSYLKALLDTFDRGLPHPTDIDRALSDASTLTAFNVLIEGLRNSDVAGFLKSCAEENPKQKTTYNLFVQRFEEMLTHAEVLLAPYKKRE